MYSNRLVTVPHGNYFFALERDVSSAQFYAHGIAAERLHETRP